MNGGASARLKALWHSGPAGPSDPLELVAAALCCAIYDLDLERRSVVWAGLQPAYGYVPGPANSRYSWWLERLHPDDREAADRDYRDFMAGRGTAWADEYRFLAADGTYRTVRDHATVVRHADGRALRVVGLMVDTSAEKQLETNLQAAESRYRQLVESLPLVTYVDEPGGRPGTVYVSPQVEDLLGYSQAEWLVDSEFFRKVLHPSDRKHVLERLERPIDETGRRSSEYRVLAKDARTVWVQDETVVVRDGNGSPLYNQGYVVDVTERKQMEAALRRRDAILEAVGFAAERFLGAASWRDVIDDVLARLGDAAAVSSVYIFENESAQNGVDVRIQRGEWVADTAPSQIDRPEPIRRPLGHDWAEKLGSGQVVHESASKSPPELQLPFLDQGLRSITILPVFVEREWWGLMGFEDCEKERVWSSGELEALRVAAGALGAAIARERVEAGLVKANEDFQTAAAAIKCAIYEWDVVAEEVHWTEGITGAFGYVLDEVETTYEWWLERVHPDDRARMGEVARAAAAGALYSGEYRFRARDGGYRDVWDSAVAIRDEAGQPRRLIGGMLDVTERKQVEEALRRSEEQYRVLFDASPSPKWVCDLETLRFLAVNEAAVRTYGYAREEFVGMTAFDLGLLDEAPSPSVAGRSTAPKIYETGDFRHRRKDGRLIDVAITVHEIDFEGRPAQLVIARDVTEQRSLEDQLRQAQKMEAVGRLAGGIAHDFNNLLTVINGYGALALDRVVTGADASEEIEEVRRAGERAAGLTSQLLAFSRQQVLRPVVLDLNSIVAEDERLLRRIIGEDVELVTSLVPSLAPVRADRSQIEQVIMNLCVNARDAMPDGGRLTIETAEVQVGGASQAGHPGVPPGVYVTLTVADTGIGLDEETRARMFEPFFTTKEPGKGTGLGLSTVYGIVEQSGGYVRVASEPGHGATLRVYLPRVASAEESAADQTSDRAVNRGSETILLAEDEPVVAGLVEEILRQAGYTVLTAMSGSEALEVAAACEGGIDLLLTDVVMPTMRGPELARRLLDDRPGMRVLFMSGYAERAVFDRETLPPGQDFVGKPFSPTQLTERVRALLHAA